MKDALKGRGEQSSRSIDVDDSRVSIADLPFNDSLGLTGTSSSSIETTESSDVADSYFSSAPIVSTLFEPSETSHPKVSKRLTNVHDAKNEKARFKTNRKESISATARHRVCYLTYFLRFISKLRTQFIISTGFIFNAKSITVFVFYNPYLYY